MSVRVVIPVHDGARFLAEAIESVLGQRGPEPELVVVDDGSTDGSGEVARSFGPRVRCHRIAHAGIAAARNAGLADCDAELVTMLDADDVWAPTALAELMAAVGDGSCDLVFGQVVQFVSPDAAGTGLDLARYDGRAEPGYLAGTCLMRRSVWEAVGPFREDLVSGEFLDWILRAHELGIRERLIEAPVLRRRIHSANHGRLRPEGRADYARTLKRALDRRRAVG